ncbi:predicted protein [Chaetomium globosum CBS 148.51]|uniref:Uncharacterized protein n=1 Tax=Chaetomium globosum (strain ATCC 6205 / CBS 148.51 / DSM 1962 / NBRC 6347 / NRRL 1970) TaxID=306901 RepID=Q2GT48_CHAGB|nr:uncharacterized protein CHGG_08856 [Chaetomium globosum CBS 148.51]EAQ84842.1 predicted protein [Chaetomium globosum CBS 148.51]
MASKPSTCCGKSAECICANADVSGPCDGSCNCSGSEDGAFDPSEHETDFTTKK